MKDCKSVGAGNFDDGYVVTQLGFDLLPFPFSFLNYAEMKFPAVTVLVTLSMSDVAFN